jgi:hypothetical protein
VTRNQPGSTLFAALVAAILPVAGLAQTDGPPPRFAEAPPAVLPPPTDVTAVDAPSDNGTALDVRWTLPTGVDVDSVRVYRMTGAGESTWIATLIGPATALTDGGLGSGDEVRYVVEAFVGDTSSRSNPTATAAPEPNLFRTERANQLVVLIIIISAIGYFTFFASRGREFYIRKIAGLDAVEEAVGRATEMGRSVLFIPGIQDLDDVQTLAGLTILSQIATKVAQYETRLDVPVSRSLVMSTGRETVREAYLRAGRPDLYNDDIVHYVTDEQFGYVAAVDGIMVREKPAACFYLGAFFAESLVLAETGNSIKAIQVAGTAMPTQLPFFVAACDYTLIGEELFAASAYLAKDLKTIGSLRGQDVGKLMAMAAILLGVIGTIVPGLGAMTQGILWLFSVE